MLKSAVLRFSAPLGDLGATYDNHLWFIGKPVVDFLVLIEVFSLSVTAEALRANNGSQSAISLQGGSVDPTFHIKGVVSTNHCFSIKLG